ncbi:hypothetical protein BGZ99_005278 [Dissophora globulifera]|uniref:Cytochrome P450 n=1 Tax=Dissophora globulifera TaxID=979702 RepID=A0A9P6RF93_9FUNG|nr:hypothetical protein BGZ99_005278 [Dissophora globulifera]
MFDVDSYSSIAIPANMLKVALPIGIGLASAVYLTMKMTNHDGFSTDRSIPMVRIRSGDTTHDAEYFENQDKFLAECEKTYGLVFNCLVLGQKVTVVSGSLAREIFMNQDFSFMDAIDEMTGIQAFTMSVIKSNRRADSPVIHEIIRDNISPNLPLFTPRIVEQLTTAVEKELGDGDGKLVENPLRIFQNMIAGAMASVFMGLEVAKNQKVLDSFIDCTYDFGQVLGQGKKDSWHAFGNRAKYGVLNPLRKHVNIMVEAATPVILKRRQQEAEAVAKGQEYKRPMDIMQRLLDNSEKYGFIDIEDEVLAQIAKERQQERQSKLDAGEVASERDFDGTKLDSRRDLDFSAAAIKRMVRMDSFVREIFRFRMERLSLAHLARKNVVLSNGMVITKGSKAIINMRSINQDSEMQGEDPTEFRPWRFVGKSKSATKASGDFLAFGMGRHACPGRFLAIQELKTVGSLMVQKYSKIEIQDPSKSMSILLSRLGQPLDTGLIFTSRTFSPSAEKYY